MTSVPDDVRMSRARLYVLIDSCEQDMRNMIERYLLQDQSEEEVFTEVQHEDLVRRRDADSGATDEGLLHYLDIGPTYETLIRHKSALPDELALEISTNAQNFAQLIPVRHRVMHGRPLHADDPRLAVVLLTPFTSRHWQHTKETLGRLESDPTWEPYFPKQPVPFEKVLHNLPEVDYDETTFIGRKDEKQRLLDALKRRRHSVITVTGEGGIGKTALALDVAYQLLDSVDNPYEAILWVSLKTEKLTAFGVEELKDAIRGFDETVGALGRGLVSDFEGSLRDLAAGLEGIDALIIIDNLESAQGHEIVSMYDALPTSVNYLFTSRWGVGQLERIFPLPPLSEGESTLLLRRFASNRRQARLSSLSEEAAKQVVKELRFSPLAIRWFVLASESGRVPLDALRDQQDVLDFCVRNVVENLSEDSRVVLTVLRALDRPIGFDEFSILTDMGIDVLRKVTQELTRSSLVLVEAETAGAIAGRLALTTTARTYLPPPDHNGSFIAAVMQRERQFKASLQDAQSQSDTSRIFTDRVHPRDASDHTAMYLLQTAISFAKAGQYDNAHKTVERARAFNPEYYEVYRVSGFIRARQGHNEAAVSDFKQALVYAHDARGLAITNYSLADTIGRKLHDTSLAIQYAQAAYEEQPCGDSAFLLGRLLVWSGNYEDGQGLILDALDNARGRHKVIVTTALVDSWGRWAESCCRVGAYDEAIVKAATGFHTGEELQKKNPDDTKITDSVIECVINYLRALPQVSSDQGDVSDRTVHRIVDYVRSYGNVVSIRKRTYLRDALDSAISQLGATSKTGNSLRHAREALTN